MKNSKINFAFLTIVILSEFTIGASAETNYFVPASIPENSFSYSYNTTANVVNCDALATDAACLNPIGGCPGELTVMVWDNYGSYDCFGWDDNYGGTGIGQIDYNDAQYIDVSIIDRTNHAECYALIVYYSSNTGGPYLEVWHWNKSTQDFTQISAGPLDNVPCNTVNIDGDWYGGFVITWDDATNNYIQVWSGLTGTGTPTLSGGGLGVGSPYVITSPTGAYPDVAIHNDDQTSQDNVYLTYINPSGTHLYEFTQPCSTVIGGSFSTGGTDGINYDAVSIYETLFAPRIAAASDLYDGTGHYDRNNSWTVTAQSVNSNSPTSDILVWYKENNASLPAPKYNITDGGAQSPGTINSEMNSLPCVTYDQLNVAVMVGWTSFYSQELTNFVPGAPVALQFDIYPSSIALASAQYMVLPSNNLSSSFRESPSAIAGRHYKNIYHCFYDDNNSKTYYKEANYSVSSLRKSGQQSNEATVFPNPFHSNLTVLFNNTKLIDSELLTATLVNEIGTVLFREVIYVKKINQLVQWQAKDLPQGVYFLKVSGSQNGELINVQVVKI